MGGGNDARTDTDTDTDFDDAEDILALAPPPTRGRAAQACSAKCLSLPFQGKFSKDAAALLRFSTKQHYGVAFARISITILCILWAVASCYSTLRLYVSAADFPKFRPTVNFGMWASYLRVGRGDSFARGEGRGGFLAAAYTGNVSSQMTVDSDKFKKAQSFAELMARVYTHRWNKTFDRNMMGKRRYPGGKLPRQQTRVSRTFFGGVRTFGCLRDARFGSAGLAYQNTAWVHKCRAPM